MASLCWEKPIIVEPREKHTRTIVMLHGRGSTGEEFSSDLFESRCSSGETLRDLLPGYRWVFPSAPPRYSTVFAEDITEWYDVYSLTDTDARSELQVDGIRASVSYLKTLVDEEAAASPTGDVVLGGISQGFTIALLTVLMGHPRISTLIGFCSWLPFKNVLETCMNTQQNESTISSSGARNRLAVSNALESAICLQSSNPPTFQVNTIPVFVSHCVDDDVVDYAHGKSMYDILLRLGYDVTWRESPDGGHWINEPHGMNGLKSFLWRYGLVQSTE